ncbi:MAG: DUF2281 domain-containing protein [bacterium]
MTKRELILGEIEQIPEPLFEEVLDFIRFLKTKALKGKLETTIASESSLKKDWLRPEEDEAWQNL